jgi:hypothetical protein
MVYVRTLSRRIPLVEDRLGFLSQRVCSRPLEDLSRRDASKLIATLEESLNGALELDIVWGGDDGSSGESLLSRVV